MIDTSQPLTWFEFGGRWHAQQSFDGTWRVGLCKIRVVGEPETVEIGPGGLYPADPCHSCRQIIAFSDIEEETIENAVSRGYKPAKLADPP